MPLGLVMLKHRDCVERLGLIDPVKQKLGKGAFGAAYEVDLGGKSVLKFTRDPSEAQASAVLLGKHHKNIVDIHRIWVMSETHRHGLRGWYAIHRSYMTPLSKKDATLVDLLFDLYNDMSLDLKFPKATHRAMADKWRSYLRDDLIENGMTTGPFLERGMELLRQIGEAVHAMHSMGIDWEDVHSGNLMRRADGTLVVADVGWGFMHDDTKVHVPPLGRDDVEAYVKSLQVGAQSAHV